MSVPPDAVFWAVTHAGDLVVDVDGVPIGPLGTTGVDRHRFAPAAPLEPGEHELVARVDDTRYPADAGVMPDERRVRFRVVDAPVPSGNAFVSSIRRYPLVYSGQSLSNPPADEYDTECGEQVVSLSWFCNDIIPESVVRLELSGEGAIAYLLQDEILLPPSCPVYWTGGSEQTDTFPWTVAAVLPRGLSEAETSTVTVDVRPAEGPAGPSRGRPSTAWCSITRVGGATGGASTLVVAALLACLRRRPRLFRP